jgi:hypothetical protein
MTDSAVNARLTFNIRLTICQTSQKDTKDGRKLDRKKPGEYRLTKYSYYGML